MSNWDSKEVEKTLQKSTIHDRWIASYRTQENVNFFEQAMDYITDALNARKDSKFLDAGCGTCTKSILLAKRGYTPVAVDFSEAVLKMAESNIMSSGMQGKIILKRENILSLTLENETFYHILYLGVLMHIPDLETAISELSRVLKKGGIIIVSENNMCSIQSVLHRSIKGLIGNQGKYTKRTQAGLESWFETEEGMLIVRQTDIRWFKDKLTNTGFTVKKHVSGQLTELYTKFSSPILKKIIHFFNYIWFKYIKIPYPAFGNIIIFQKNVRTEIL